MAANRMSFDEIIKGIAKDAEKYAEYRAERAEAEGRTVGKVQSQQAIATACNKYLHSPRSLSDMQILQTDLKSIKYGEPLLVPLKVTFDLMFGKQTSMQKLDEMAEERASQRKQEVVSPTRFNLLKDMVARQITAETPKTTATQSSQAAPKKEKTADQEEKRSLLKDKDKDKDRDDDSSHWHGI